MFNLLDFIVDVITNNNWYSTKKIRDFVENISSEKLSVDEKQRLFMLWDTIDSIHANRTHDSSVHDDKVISLIQLLTYDNSDENAKANHALFWCIEHMSTKSVNSVEQDNYKYILDSLLKIENIRYSTGVRYELIKLLERDTTVISLISPHVIANELEQFHRCPAKIKMAINVISLGVLLSAFIDILLIIRQNMPLIWGLVILAGLIAIFAVIAGSASLSFNTKENITHSLVNAWERGKSVFPESLKPACLRVEQIASDGQKRDLEAAAMLTIN